VILNWIGHQRYHCQDNEPKRNNYSHAFQNQLLVRMRLMSL
jgi:hypothetical protein